MRDGEGRSAFYWFTVWNVQTLETWILNDDVTEAELKKIPGDRDNTILHTLANTQQTFSKRASNTKKSQEKR